MDRHAARRPTGFTLLELLLVLALLSLMAGLALPRMVTLYDTFQWAGERDDVLRTIGELGLQASRQGRAFELAQYPNPDDTAVPLSLPADWQLTTESPIEYKYNGVCLGGTAQLSHQDRTVNIVLKPPYCQPEIP